VEINALEKQLTTSVILKFISLIFLELVFLQTELKIFDISYNKLDAEANKHLANIVRSTKAKLKDEMVLNLEKTSIAGINNTR
jgi:hypothetical protein